MLRTYRHRYDDLGPLVETSFLCLFVKRYVRSRTQMLHHFLQETCNLRRRFRDLHLHMENKHRRKHLIRHSKDGGIGGMSNRKATFDASLSPNSIK